jgi:hypothetical protein
VGEDGADVVPALAMLTVGTLQQNFHDIDDAPDIAADPRLRERFPQWCVSGRGLAAHHKPRPLSP